MDSKQHNVDEDDNELVFQNLTPEKPANALQKGIIHIQHNWNKRHLFILLTVLSSLFIFLLVFEVIRPLTQQNRTTDITTNSGPIITMNVAQMFSYANVVYVLVNQASDNTGTLEALNARTGTLVWSYAHHNTEGIKLFGNILYIQTDTNLVALNATNRKQLWEKQMFSDVNHWQTDQDILFTESTKGIVTALNAFTGAQLWQTQQPSNFWQIDNGIFYTIPPSGPGLKALNAQNGQQRWDNPSILYEDLTIGNGNIYLQDNEKQRIQAYDGKNDSMLWQLKTHENDFILSARNGFLFLSAVKEAQVEVMNGQTGKSLWQHQGMFNILTESPNQTAILSTQKNETDIIRTADGVVLYHFSGSDALLSIENGIAFFVHYPLSDSNGNTALIISIKAIRISTGTTIWSSQALDTIPLLQNSMLDIVSTSNNSLLSLRADNGHAIWQHTFNPVSK